MKKRLLFLIFLGAAVVSGMGCGQEQKENIEKEAENKPVLEIYAGQSEKENIGLLADAYEEQIGEAEINIHLIPDSEYTQQMMRIKNQEAPADCIFFQDAGEAAVWQHKKVFKELSPWYADSEEKKYYESWYGSMEDEAYYLIPYRIGKICVYYNKTLFDRLNVSYPGEDWTWEEYKAIAKRLTGWSDNKKVYGTLGFGGGSKWWMLPARTAGAFDPFDGEDLEMFRRSAEWCHEFTSEFAAAFPYFEWEEDDWSGYNNTLFLEGRLGMYFGEDSEVNVLNEEIRKQGIELEYDVAKLPAWEGKEPAKVCQTAVVAMAEASQHPDEAYRFMEFCAGAAGGMVLAENGTVPAWQSSEVWQSYLESTKIPVHTEYFLSDGIPTENNTPGVLYYAGLEAMKNEVSLYLMSEQELDYTFANIEEELKILKAEQS
ncbi:MAG: extracellular solute-binding protein [Eubacteriales bacterium]|nr:extracellular solute-binding protein [Eubacteriales bacterium]